MQVNLEDDRFDVTFNPKVVTSAALLETIQKLDFKPEVVTRERSDGEEAVEQVDASKLSEGLAPLFAKARTSNKVVLLQFSGPG